MGNSDLLDHQIAVIGMAGRFPGARNIDEFWRNLRDGVESVTYFSDEELADAGVAPELLSDAHYVKASAVLDNIEFFDASFFGFNPREAEIMDPQHRFFLECAWAALEHAGHDPENESARIGVYAGASANSYLLLNIYPNTDLTSSVGRYQILIGNENDFLPTRVSYKLNLKGPSINVQTSCSTSLVAVHIACQSLLNGECDLALAGGVSINLPNRTGYLYQEGGILSPDGHCRAFDARAQGTITGSGVGIVVLKRLREALADRDSVHAVIRGSATNNDGALKVGYTAPGLEGQAEVIAEALAIAEVEPHSITYVEAHGTGTALGDPVEIAALNKAFGVRQNRCAIGSVKTNIGHLDAAAGVAGLIKTILALKHGMLPPSLHYAIPNPQIDFAQNHFYVNTQLTEWTEVGPRRAAVSSFGIGGTNAHLVLEEAPAVEASAQARPWQLLVLSAKSETALQSATRNLILALKHEPTLDLSDATYTYQLGRRAFNHRRMVVCRDADDAARALEQLSPRRVFTQARESGKRSVAFMFPGQGAQYANMGRELYRFESSFRRVVDFSAEFLTSLLGIDLRDLLFPDELEIAGATSKLRQTSIAQPALFVIEHALARLLMEWGVRPRVLFGHSIGEYVAACLAGVFALEDALSLVALRGNLMQEMPEGAMLSVALSETEARTLLREGLSLAAVNAPSLCVISGPVAAVGQLEKQLVERGVGCQRLHTSHAFHSAMMEPVIGPFTRAVAKLQLHAPHIPFISNVTGTWITAAAAMSPEYWGQHLRQPVQCDLGLREMAKDSSQVLLEVGPGHTLSRLARRSGNAGEHVVLSSLPTTSPSDSSESEEAFLLTTLGRVWLSGGEVDWTGFHAQERRRRIPLPTYPFEGRRYWIDPLRHNVSTRPSLLRKNSDLGQWFYRPSWRRSDRHGFSARSDQTSRRLCWIIFIDEYGPGFQLSKRLEEMGQDVFTVAPGVGFAKTGERAYSINPQQRTDYSALLKDLVAGNMTPQMIVHSWSITPDNTLKTGVEFFATSQEKGFYSLLFLAQACGEHNFISPLQLWVLSNNLQEVLGEDLLCPEKTTVLGLCKVIPQEYPNITCRNLDIVIPKVGAGQEIKLVDQLLAELSSPTRDSIVAHRGGHRWVQTFEPIQIDTVGQSRSQLREGGVYLITGGLGHIGLALAESLARTVRAKLVLVGRTTLPHRDQWEHWTSTHDEQDEVSAKIRRVQAMEALGAEVEIGGADVADEQQMKEVVKLARVRFGTLHGVIHSAGLDALRAVRPIQETNRAECEEQFHPKVAGLFVLEKVLRNEHLDFCLLQSSLSSVLGGLGFAAYSAANDFMDAFAHRQNQTGSGFWSSVNWDGWQFTGRDGGQTILGAPLIELAITPEEGFEAFQRVLSLDQKTRVVISTTDLQTRIDRWTTPGTGPDKERPSNHGPLPLHQRPPLAKEYQAPRNEVEQAVADIWKELLGIEHVGVHDNFFELGGDSLVAVRLIARLRLTFQREIPVHTFFDAPTVAELAESIRIAREEGREDDERISQLLEMMDQLSEEEITALIDERKNLAKGVDAP